MKAVYVGAVRGYRPPVYKPGMGWSSGYAGRRIGRGPSVFAHRRSAAVGPLAISQRRSGGLKAKVAIVSVIVTVVAMVLILLGGQLHL